VRGRALRIFAEAWPVRNKGKKIAAPVLLALQRKACAAKKPSDEKRFWFLLSPQKGQAQRQLSGKNNVLSVHTVMRTQ